MKRLSWLLFVFLILSCQGTDIYEGSEIISQEFENVINDNSDTTGIVMSNDCLSRAYQMATMEWTPVNPVPYRYGIIYEPGNKVTGVPYSSVKEINTYLFQDVSYHTFMTAVHNPNSVLYTEDISQSPYHGQNCAPYYGAVCSSAVMYALGFTIPYYANQIKDLPCMQKIEPQRIDSLKVCDVIWKKGHVQMIFDLEFNADTLYRITTFESSGMSAHFSSYSKELFMRMWEAEGYVGYRYEQLRYSESSPVFKSFEPIMYNEDLCPSKGDRSVYRTEDIITINIFSKRYQSIVLMKDNNIVDVQDCTSETVQYKDLGEGIYYVYLKNRRYHSPTVSFEVIKTEVNYSIDNTANEIKIRFNSSAKADFAAICTQTGDSQYYPISDIEREQGNIDVALPIMGECFCKVVFRGNYGRIINVPIKVIQ